MARAWLRDDRPERDRSGVPSPGGWVAGLDDDPSAGDPTVEWAIDPGLDGVDGPVLSDGSWVLGSVRVMARALAGFSNDGDPQYDWSLLCAGPATEKVSARSEVDDGAGSVTVSTEVTFLYPIDDPGIPETVVVVDGAGKRWAVTSATRTSDRYVLAIRRTEGTSLPAGSIIPDESLPALQID